MDWSRQREWMWGTQVRGGTGAGAEVVARTGIGPVGFADAIVITEWDPPRGSAAGASSGRRRPGPATAADLRHDRWMTRTADLGIRIGVLPAGPTASITDVPGTGVGHATVWRDEPDPPAGRGTARTGVTVLDPGGNLFRSPVPAGGAVLNGAGECTGFLAAAEWGLAETPEGAIAFVSPSIAHASASPDQASALTGSSAMASS